MVNELEMTQRIHEEAMEASVRGDIEKATAIIGDARWIPCGPKIDAYRPKSRSGGDS